MIFKAPVGTTYFQARDGSRYFPSPDGTFVITDRQDIVDAILAGYSISSGSNLFDSVVTTPGSNRYQRLSPDTAISNRNPNDAGWVIDTRYAVFGGEDGITKFVDPVIAFGYNVDCGTIWKNNTIHANGIFFESDYWDTASQKSEQYLQWGKNSLGGAIRPLFFQIDNTTGNIVSSFVCADITNGFVINDGTFGNVRKMAAVKKVGLDFNLVTTSSTYTVSFGIDKDSGGLAGITSGGTLIDLYGPASSRMRFQQNSVAGNAYISVGATSAATRVAFEFLCGAYGTPTSYTQIIAGSNDNGQGSLSTGPRVYVTANGQPAASRALHVHAGVGRTSNTAEVFRVDTVSANGTSDFAIDKDGGVLISQPAAAPATPAANHAALYWDDASKTFKYKDSTGTVKTITAA